MFQSTKTFDNLPCAHRQWRHHGHCAKVHGYSRSFHFTFGCHEVDECGFVVDFSDLKWLKAWLEDKFDHTLLLNPDDPLLPDFRAIEDKGGAKVVVIPTGVGMEGTGQFILAYTNKELQRRTGGRAWAVSVEVRENNKNSAITTLQMLYERGDGDANGDSSPG